MLLTLTVLALQKAKLFMRNEVIDRYLLILNNLFII